MLRFSPLGLREMLLGSVLLGLAGLALSHLFWPLGLLAIPAWIWLLAFFRDPDRPVPQGPGLVVSPADGVVTDIVDLPHVDGLAGPGTRVGIFLSIFDVHVNRAPCAGRVVSVTYSPGRFLNAMNHQGASACNESNSILLADPATGKPLAVVRQIAGFIARRIVCTVAPEQTVERGQRIGLIKFGSRTELLLPRALDPQIRVMVGQKVRGAADVIAILGRYSPGRDSDPLDKEPAAAGNTGHI